MRKIRVFTAIMLLNLIAVQWSHGQEIGSDIDIVKNVAENIISNTSYKIVNVKTGEKYASSSGIPLSPDYKLDSPYNDWQYWNGVLAIAMLKLSDLTKEEKYEQYVSDNYSFIFSNLDYFRAQYENGYKGSSLRQFFRLSLLDDCGAMGAGLADLYQRYPEDRYFNYMERAVDYIVDKELRLEDGTFARVKPRPLTVWADDLYMSVPFLARMGEITGNATYTTDAVNQVRTFRKHLYSSDNQLYYHCWYADVRQNGVAHWGRCNGWVMMAQAELLDKLPDHHPDREELIKYLLEHITGVARFQSKSGLWYQLIDKQDAYLESSASAMFVYSIAKAVNEGWIPSSYATIALEGWSGLTGKINPQGEVADICIGTGISDDLLFYYNRPVKLNDIHGLGAILLAGTEIVRLRQKTGK